MKHLIREIFVDRKHFIYDDPINIEVKAGYYEENDDFGLVKTLNITIIDSTYNKDKPEKYNMSFNCEHLKEQRDQDWMVDILASYMVEFILRSEDKCREYITEKTKELFKVLGV